MSGLPRSRLLINRLCSPQSGFALSMHACLAVSPCLSPAPPLPTAAGHPSAVRQRPGRPAAAPRCLAAAQAAPALAASLASARTLASARQRSATSRPAHPPRGAPPHAARCSVRVHAPGATRRLPCPCSTPSTARSVHVAHAAHAAHAAAGRAHRLGRLGRVADDGLAGHHQAAHRRRVQQRGADHLRSPGACSHSGGMSSAERVCHRPQAGMRCRPCRARRPHPQRAGGTKIAGLSTPDAQRACITAKP